MKQHLAIRRIAGGSSPWPNLGRRLGQALRNCAEALAELVQAGKGEQGEEYTC